MQNNTFKSEFTGEQVAQLQAYLTSQGITQSVEDYLQENGIQPILDQVTAFRASLISNVVVKADSSKIDQVAAILELDNVTLQPIN